MVNVKKCVTLLKYFVIILTLSSTLAGCASGYHVTKIEAKQININETTTSVSEYEKYIAPYRDQINKDLNTVLTYCPETLDKSKGEWQSNIGDMLANAVLEKTNAVFFKRENKNIDFCLLNHGGIRAILPKGDVTTRTAFEIMPFENTAIVIALNGEQITEMVNQIIKQKKPHPISGITFTIDKDNIGTTIKIKNENLDAKRVYYVVTSDYLANGGDNMTFFKKGIKSFDLDYKLRNVLIDYFKEVDIIPVVSEIKITKEN
jgi:2',3'-cyclic-nucleotide 2'-phosphodiesterase (5'-nucleotidase family)